VSLDLGRPPSYRPGVRRRRSRAWPILLLGLTTCPQISRHELACEEAKARLIRCCPGFTGPSLSCEDTSGEFMGCDQVEIDLSDARCVTDLACDALVESGTCARAQENWGSPGASSTWNATICQP
jgi:hypothetical protein